MALIFGLLAASHSAMGSSSRLYACLPTDPLKSFRQRQYLCEGSEGWYMPLLAGAVPGISLFIFLAGLGNHNTPT